MKQRGSALIIAMMLIATVGAAAFGISKLLYIDSAVSTAYENGTVAYYSAESGIETAFLLYKYNMNAEVPLENWLYDDTKVYITNLANKSVETGTLMSGINNTTQISNPAKQYYDLRMGYLGTNLPEGGPFFSHDIDKDGTTESSEVLDPNFSANEYSFLRIPRDEARKFDLSNVDLSLTGNKLKIGFKFIGVANNDADKCKAMAEVKFLVTTGVTAKEYKALTSFNATTCAGYVSIPAGKMDGAILPSTFDDSNFYYKFDDILNIILTKSGDTINSPSSGNNVIMTVKPLYYDADVYFSTATCDSASTLGACKADKKNIVTGPYSYVASTGYYGGVSRSLSANIDRQSGTLYDLYDYVLFKSN